MNAGKPLVLTIGLFLSIPSVSRPQGAEFVYEHFLRKFLSKYEGHVDGAIHRVSQSVSAVTSGLASGAHSDHERAAMHDVEIDGEEDPDKKRN